MNLWKLIMSLIILLYTANTGQTQDDSSDGTTAPPPIANTCNGIFLSYTFISREKEYPHLKNASAQPWAFKSVATILNTGKLELKAWKMYIGFRQQEILVSAGGGVLLDGNDFPAAVGTNGTYFGGYPQTDLKTAIDTANDETQIQARIQIKGTQFGILPPGVPMPKTIRLENDGYKCPAPTRRTSSMFACCVRNPKLKAKNVTTKFTPRQKADLSMSYDILNAYGNNYLVQVELLNNNPIGRLDHWNLTWEWQRGEFIYSMRGAYTYLKDGSGCIFGTAGQHYQDFDFSQVQNCEKKPTITDMPPDKANDDKLGKLPYCCRNGTLLPTTMSKDKSKAVFQLQVYKIPPDTSRTDLYPPANWKIVGVLNPSYKCSQPIRVDPQEYPDETGLQEVTRAVASWQVACNITRPKASKNRCCVSFSAYYNDSAIPCNTCACGCENEKKKCNQNAKAMFLPSEALLVPFSNRSAKAVAWAKINHFRVPKPLPCGDNCGVSINWHVDSSHKSGWTGRITLFNWEVINFEDWFVALQFKKSGKGFQKAYSFNGTMLKNPNNTIFMQGLPGLNYLMGETNGSRPGDPRVPGKQQSVLSFEKRFTWGIKVSKGDGFPSRVYFNGEECALPKDFPIANGRRKRANIVMIALLIVTHFLLLRNIV